MLKAKIWKEPLVHFLLIGAGLFLLFGATRGLTPEKPNRIVIDAGQVAQLTANFERTWMRPPTETELSGLINGFVRDEVYYREALALGLDKNDLLIRRRMRQKLEFALADLSVEETPSDEVLQAFLQQHQDRYTIKPRVAFRHIYLNPDKHQNLTAAAEKLLERLALGDPPERLGDPIMLDLSFALSTQAEIARQFGEAFAQEIFDLSTEEWAGPIYSGLGVHLVEITAREAGRVLSLDEVRSSVERDWLAQKRKEVKDMAYEKLLEGYEVIIEPQALKMDGKSPVAGQSGMVAQ